MVNPEVVAEIVKGAVMLLLALIGGGIGWDQVKRHGAETERRKQAERRADEAEATLRHRSRPVPTDREYGERLRRAKDRFARLRDREAKR